MTDKTPDQWTQQYMPSLSEWKGGFAADVTNAVAQSKAYTDAQIGTLPTQVQANTTALAATARNPASAVQDMGGHKITNLAAGSVASDAVRADQVIVGDGSTYWDAGLRRLINLASPTLATDAARLDAVSWQRLGPDAVFTGTAGMAQFSIPGVYNAYKVEWVGLQPFSAADLFFQISQDGGGTWHSNSTDYISVVSRSIGGTSAPAVLSIVNSYANVGYAGAVGAHNGSLVIDPIGFFARAENAYNSTGPALTFQTTSVAMPGLTSRPNAIRIGFSVVVTGGRVRLSGWGN